MTRSFLSLNQASRINKIGDYILGKSIGKGTFGKVKKGIHTKTNEKVGGLLDVGGCKNT